MYKRIIAAVCIVLTVAIGIGAFTYCNYEQPDAKEKVESYLETKYKDQEFTILSKYTEKELKDNPLYVYAYKVCPIGSEGLVFTVGERKDPSNNTLFSEKTQFDTYEFEVKNILEKQIVDKSSFTIKTEEDIEKIVKEISEYMRLIKLGLERWGFKTSESSATLTFKIKTVEKTSEIIFYSSDEATIRNQLTRAYKGY